MIQKLNSKSSYKSYIFIDKKYIIEEVLKHYTKEKKKIDFDGNLVNMFSLRYELFKNKGCKCVECGREGSFFLLQKSKSSKEKNPYHFGLWSEDLVQLTKDHIIPKSLGGTNTLDNFVTMCEICNSKKGNKCTLEDIKNGKSFNKSIDLENKKKINYEDIFKVKKFAAKLKKKDKLYLKYRNEISIYMKKNQINPYLNREIIEKEIQDKIYYLLNFYLKIINYVNGNISYKNNAFIGLPKAVRQELIEKYKSQ